PLAEGPGPRKDQLERRPAHLGQLAVEVVRGGLRHLAEEAQGHVQALARPPAGARQALLAARQDLGDVVGHGDGGEQADHAVSLDPRPAGRKARFCLRKRGRAPIFAGMGPAPGRRETHQAMNDFNNGFTRPATATADMSVDAGLRAFMLGVYNKVALGLLLSAALAWVTGSYPPVRDLMFQYTPEGFAFTPLGEIVGFAPLAILLFSAFAMRNA